MTTARWAMISRIPRRPTALAKKRLKGDGPPFVRIGRAIRYRRSDLDLGNLGRPVTGQIVVVGTVVFARDFFVCQQQFASLLRLALGMPEARDVHLAAESPFHIHLSLVE